MRAWWLLVIITLVATLGVACASRGERCASCGMPIDPASSWRADLVSPTGETRHYDSPRCALRAWRGGRFDASRMRVVEYYTKRWVDANDVVYVIGSDILGPMGADLVPVDPAHADKLSADHAAGRAIPLSSITKELVDQLR